METINVELTTAWTKLCDDSDAQFLISAVQHEELEIAATATDAAPGAGVKGHRIGGVSQAVSRAVLPSGFIWARTTAGGGFGTTVVAVTK